MEQLSQEELARIQKAAREASQALAKSLRLLAGGNLKHLTKNMQLLQKQLISPILQDAIRTTIAALSQWVEPMLRSQQWLLQLMESEAKKRRVAKAFEECDLWLAPSMTELTDKIVQLYYEGKKQVIPSIVTRYYKKNNWDILRKTVSSWEDNSFSRPRMGIIYDALEAHINGKYTLSVPALLPHIEGVATDIVEKYHLPKLDKPLIYRGDAYGKKGAITSPSRVFGQVAISALSFEEWVAVESLLCYLEGTMYLSPRKVGKKLKHFATKDILNRHSILHGAHIKYATPMNSLRCFLALDVLSLIDAKENKQG